MEHDTDIIDTLAMGLGGALVVMGIVGLGIVEVLAGTPYGAAPVTNEAGEVVAMPTVDPALRTGLVLLGLAVLLGWRVVRLVGAVTADGPTPRRAPADD